MPLKGRPFAKIGAILKNVAPTFLEAMGGPAGAAIAMAVAKKTLGEESITDEQVEDRLTALAGSTEGLVKLKELEVRMQEVEAEHDFKFADLDRQDRADARARQISMRDHAPEVVLYITTLGFYGTLGYLLVYGLPPNGGEVLLMMVGALGSAWGAAVQYFVGSSAGSRQKTDILSGGGK